MEAKKKSILLVDDNATSLTVANALLSNSYTVYTAISGIRMFKILEKIRPDIILLDIEMPEMNGYEVLERLKGNSDTADIPVVFLTAHEIETVGPLPKGLAGYITKPFVARNLLSSVERILFAPSGFVSGIFQPGEQALA